MNPLDAWNYDDKLPNIIWVVLNDAVRNELVKQINFKFDKNNLKDNMSLHHATIFFKPTQNDVNKLNLWATKNDEITVEIIENCWNDKIQALKVKLINTFGKELNLPDKIFHITVSADKGVQPKQSNNMLAVSHNSEPLNIKVKGTLVFHNY